MAATTEVCSACAISLLASCEPDLQNILRSIYHNNNNNDRLTAFDPGQPG